VLEEDGVEFKQLDEDHARRAQRRVVNDEVVDVVGSGENATAKETMGGAAAARRGDVAAALHTQGRGAQYKDERYGSRVDHVHRLIMHEVR
jgi:hypothetical protein